LPGGIEIIVDAAANHTQQASQSGHPCQGQEAAITLAGLKGAGGFHPIPSF